jgi:hypothetical protein
MQIDSLSSWLKYWYKIRFKIRVARFAIRLKRFKKKTFKPKKPDIDNTQKKTIDLFYALLKSKDTNLNYSPESFTRFIESDYVWITMNGHINEYRINIIDESRPSNPHSHEVNIPKEYGFEMADEFDLELEKRFRSIEATKKKVIVDDIDKLILKVNTPKK